MGENLISRNRVFYSIISLFFALVITITFNQCSQLLDFQQQSIDEPPQNGQGYGGIRSIPSTSEASFEITTLEEGLKGSQFYHLKPNHSCLDRSEGTVIPSHAGLIDTLTQPSFYQPNQCDAATYNVSSLSGSLYNSRFIESNGEIFEASNLPPDTSRLESFALLYCRSEGATVDEGIDVVIKQYVENQSDQWQAPREFEMVTTSSIPQGLTFRRNDATSNDGTAPSYFDNQGQLRFAAAGEPRFDHHPITGAKRGLLLESDRRNFFRSELAINSSDYDFRGVTLSQSSVLSPNPDETSLRLSTDSSNGIHEFSYFFPTTFTNSGEQFFTFSTFVRPGLNGFV